MIYHFILVRLWHRCCSNLQIEFLPDLGHITNGLRTKGASISALYSSYDRAHSWEVQRTAKGFQRKLHERKIDVSRAYWKWSLISFKQCWWIVCPHGITVTSFLELNKYCKSPFGYSFSTKNKGCQIPICKSDSSKSPWQVILKLILAHYYLANQFLLQSEDEKMKTEKNQNYAETNTIFTSKQTGQSWCIAPSIQGWLFWSEIE